ncbi:MAG: S-(hydroxymethyl)glutathione dehydrogenase / alcohol dehydrogenase [Gaiellales bacterium]|jgi:Zn-dependent alcohol dehydrogenase|nr:S-(hydroxymethyl)glutathione dehydrogenase / alcohol dehydrogenase [Gaiellales bacterium]
MKAAVCHAFGEPLAIDEVELARPAGGEVRVRLEACAVCHSDVAYASGAWGGSLPAIYGHEAAGVVQAVGDEAGGLAPGDHVVVTLVRSCGSCHVCLRGQPALCGTRFPLDERSPLRTAAGIEIVQGLRTAGFAEEVVVHCSQAVRIRPEMPLDRACLLACGVVTGYGAVVNTAQVAVGDSVAVIGAGGVGVNCIQGAVLAGAAPIIAIDLAPAKLAAAAAFGATHLVDATRADAARTVRALGGGRGVDCAIVAAGATAAVESALRLVRRGGTVVIVGMPAAGGTVELDPAGLAHDGIRILGSKLGSTRPAVDIPLLVDLYLDQRLLLEELVSSRVPLTFINDALERAGRGDSLRTVIEL